MYKNPGTGPKDLVLKTLISDYIKSLGRDLKYCIGSPDPLSIKILRKHYEFHLIPEPSPLISLVPLLTFPYSVKLLPILNHSGKSISVVEDYFNDFLTTTPLSLPFKFTYCTPRPYTTPQHPYLLPPSLHRDIRRWVVEQSDL